MTKVLVDETNLTNIANAIRTKNELTTNYKPSEMSSAISNIDVGIPYATSTLSSLDYLKSIIKKVPADIVNVSSDMSEYFSFCSSLEEVELFDTSSVTNMSKMFYKCYNLTTIPQFDTSNVTNMSNMFAVCCSITTLPVLNTSSVTNMTGMITGMEPKDNTIMNNILAMCINATSYTGTKTLVELGFNRFDIQYWSFEDRLTSLSNYQAFTNAGWTMGSIIME